MDNETCTVCIVEKHMKKYYKNIQNAKTATSNEV